MWSNIISNSLTPPSRYKHSTVLCQIDKIDYLFLYGGKSGRTFQLKDFWSLELKSGTWTEIRPVDANDFWPPPLQQHTLVYNDDQLYLFGGEISIDTTCPLWIFHVKTGKWRKWGLQLEERSSSNKSQLTPMGRRGHTCSVYNGYMFICGGYRDLKGSLSDLWAFHFETESWHLFSYPPKVKQYWPFNENHPPARHDHSAVVHAGALYIFGGMTDLEERSDFWKFDIESRKWQQVKSRNGPGCLHKHVAAKALANMFVFSGERDGKPFDEFWRFSFNTEVWERIVVHGSRPCARIFASCAMLPALIKVTESRENKYWWDNFDNLLATSASNSNNYQVLNESCNSSVVYDNQLFDENNLIDFEEEHVTERRAAKVRKSSSVRFADLVSPLKNSMPNSTSDYSSMENFQNSFENPNYLGPNKSAESFEMRNVDKISVHKNLEIKTPNYLLLIGGLESHSSTVFKTANINIWRLRVTNELFSKIL